MKWPFLSLVPHLHKGMALRHCMKVLPLTQGPFPHWLSIYNYRYVSINIVLRCHKIIFVTAQIHEFSVKRKIIV